MKCTGRMALTGIVGLVRVLLSLFVCVAVVLALLGVGTLVACLVDLAVADAGVS